MFLVVIRINIWVTMQFSEALDPHTGVTPILFIVYSHAVPAGATPVQLPGHGLLVIQGVLVY